MFSGEVKDKESLVRTRAFTTIHQARQKSKKREFDKILCLKRAFIKIISMIKFLFIVKGTKGRRKRTYNIQS